MKRDRRKKKLYVKIFPIDSFEGSIRWQLDSAERGVWWDFVSFAGICAQEGWICDKDKRPFPHDFIANRFNVTLELFETTLTKCKAEGRITENDKGIFIVNFKEYQSEYSRQKPYREKKKQAIADEEAKETNRQPRIALACRKKRKELGRELTTEERLKIEEEVGRE